MERVAAYGFLGRFAGDVMRDRYMMPTSVSGVRVPGAGIGSGSDRSPETGDRSSSFRLFSLVLWPDVFSTEEHLLSLKVRSKEGIWKERLVSPEPLGHYVPPVLYETVLGAVVPPAMRTHPGRFLQFVGDEPLSWASLVPSSKEATLALPTSLSGAVAVGWSGALRGLLLLGTVPS